MSIVSSLKTGRMGFTVTFRRASPAWESTVTWSAPTGPQTWTLSRRAVLYLTAVELGYEDAEASRMALSGMVIWANESGWGGHEYRWNGWGCHPYEGDAGTMEFGHGDPELAAFPDLHSSARKFWSVAFADAAVAARFRAGDPLAAVALTRTAFGGGNVMPDADAQSIFTRLQTYLSTSETPAGDGPQGAGPRGPGRSSSGSGKWVLALAALAALAASAKKTRG